MTLIDKASKILIITVFPIIISGCVKLNADKNTPASGKWEIRKFMTYSRGEVQDDNLYEASLENVKINCGHLLLNGNGDATLVFEDDSLSFEWIERTSQESKFIEFFIPSENFHHRFYVHPLIHYYYGKQKNFSDLILARRYQVVNAYDDYMMLRYRVTGSVPNEEAYMLEMVLTRD